MLADFVDFGIHVADNKTVYKTITVRNTGSTPASYRIDYKGEHPIGFSPQSAKVQPNSAIAVEVRTSPIPFDYSKTIPRSGVSVNFINSIGR